MTLLLQPVPWKIWAFLAIWWRIEHEYVLQLECNYIHWLCYYDLSLEKYDELFWQYTILYWHFFYCNLGRYFPSLLVTFQYQQHSLNWYFIVTFEGISRYFSSLHVTFQYQQLFINCYFIVTLEDISPSYLSHFNISKILLIGFIPLSGM